MWASLLVAALLAQAPPEPPAQANPDQQQLTVRRLIRQLDSPRLAERQAAEEKLISMGAKALELLPSSTDQLSAEVQQRLARVRQKLQQELTESFTQPARVTLHGEMPLSKALTAIQQQTGNAVGPGRPDAAAPANEPSIKVDLDKVPFWQAVDQVLGQAGLRAYPYGEQAGLQLIPRPANEITNPSLASYSGAFRFEVISALARRTFRVPNGGSLELSIEAAWEPRLSPIALDQPISAITAVGDDGKPMAIAQRRARLEVPVVSQARAVEFQIPMELPSRNLKRIARLHGTLSTLMPGKIETFRFDKLPEAANVQKRIGSATVTLQQVRKNNDVWEVRLRVGYDETHGALASHRTWMFSNEAYLEAPDGQKVAYDTFESTAQTENEFGVAYLFALDKPLDKYVFVYKTPGVILSARFTYDFSNIDLP